jgi:hypothetical protein
MPALWRSALSAPALLARDGSSGRHHGTKLAREGADRRVVHGRTVLRRASAGVGFASNRARRWCRGDPRLPHPWRPRVAPKDHTAVWGMRTRAWRTIWSRSVVRRCVVCSVPAACSAPAFGPRRRGSSHPPRRLRARSTRVPPADTPRSAVLPPAQEARRRFGPGTASRATVAPQTLTIRAETTELTRFLPPGAALPGRTAVCCRAASGMAPALPGLRRCRDALAYGLSRVPPMSAARVVTEVVVTTRAVIAAFWLARCSHD